MITITREAIRQMASSETVYYRGMRYYADKAVSRVTWSGQSGQYRAVVRGNSQYMVTIQVNHDGMDMEYSCNCPAHIKYTGACKHVVATLLFISDYNEEEDRKQYLSSEDKKAYQVVQYFKKREYRRLEKTQYHLKLTVTVDALLHRSSGRAAVSMMAGHDRMYKVGNIKKFLADYYHGSPISLGKEFRYNPGECVFDEQSKEVLDYFLDIYEFQEILGKSYYSSIFSGANVMLSQNMLYKLLKRLNHVSCNLSLFGKMHEDVQVVCGNPGWEIGMELEEGGIVVRGDVHHSLTPLCEDGSLMFFCHAVYLPDREYVWNVLPFFASVGKDASSRLRFQGENMLGFVETVLPSIHKPLGVHVPQSIKEKYAVEELSAALYMDIATGQQKKYISAEVVFSYGEHQVNPLAKTGGRNGVVIIRDHAREEELLGKLCRLHFKPCGETFLLKGEKDIYDLLQSGLLGLLEDFTVYYSEDYRRMTVNRIERGQVHVRMMEDKELFALEFSYQMLPEGELAEFFRSVRLKKKYHRLRDGSFLSLEDAGAGRELERLQRLVAHSEGFLGNSLLFKKQMAYYIDNTLLDWEEMQAEREEDYTRLVDALKYPDIEDIKVPSCMQGILRPYQVAGYRWLKTLDLAGLGGILADDMGLGKTLQSICYICSREGSKNLIVCPASLTINWQEEFEKFAPHVSTCIIAGTPKEREYLIMHSPADVWITSYPMLRKDIAKYSLLEFDTMIIDEAQYIKNLGSLCAKSVKTVKAKRRFALTGTPIENSLSELWSVFDFIMPGYLPKYSRFVQQFEKPIVREGDKEALDELTRHISPFILRRLKKEVLPELPDKIETHLTAKMTPQQEKAYVAYLSGIKKDVREQLPKVTGRRQMEILAVITRLRQICCHPAMFMESYKADSGKMELLTELLQQLFAGGHRIILFSQFTSMLAIIRERLEEMGIVYYLLQGNTKVRERADMVRRFNRGEGDIFLISLKAGGTGLNLTGADTVIHYDPWWNPAVEEQATDRAYRIGQDKNVQVFKLVTKGTIEEKIYRLQARKKQLSQAVIKPGEQFIQGLSKEEWMSLFAYENQEE